MALSQNLINEFAKAVAPKEEENKEITTTGTFKMINGVKYVKLDGANDDVYTPVDWVVEAKDDDRVMVSIKNHNATITGNLTTPSSHGDYEELEERIEVVEGDIVTIDSDISSINSTLTIQDSKIQSLDNIIDVRDTRLSVLKANVEANTSNISIIGTDLVTSGTLLKSMNDTITSQGNTITAVNNAFTFNENNVTLKGSMLYSVGDVVHSFNNDITILNSGFTIVDGELTGLSAIIINSLKTDVLDAEYAEIDFANIEDAAIQKMFASTGLIDNLVVRESAIVSGELSAVTINGDSINAGTIKADKIYLQDDEDGLYYALNSNAEISGLSQDEYNSLSGSILTRKSVNAEKVSVSDLSAFEATIGGFHLTQHAIYSGLKASVDSADDGIYMNDDGEIAIGDDSDYIKYYLDDDDNRNLEIKTNSITLTSSGKTVEETINDSMTNAIATSQTQTAALITENNDNIYATVNTSIFDATKNLATKESVETKLDSNQLALKVQKQLEDGIATIKTETGFVFDNSGLTISSTESGISTNIDNDGMDISEGGSTVLTADHNGVTAHNLHADTYLIIGKSSRFEDYEKNGEARTGCFWIGGNI